MVAGYAKERRTGGRGVHRGYALGDRGDAVEEMGLKGMCVCLARGGGDAL